MRKVGFIKSIAIAAVIFCSTVSYAAQKGTVTTNDLNVRSGPGVNYSVLNKTNKGDIVTILEEKQGWYKIALKSGDTGWVNKSYVTITDITDSSSTKEMGEVVKESVYLRKEASWSSSNYGIVAKGSRVEILEKGPVWIKVRYANNIGYISKDYISIIDNSQQSPEDSNSSKENAEIIKESVFLRKSPTWGSEKTKILPVGTKVEYIGIEGQWVKIKHGNDTGYISNEYVKILSDKDELIRKEKQDKLVALAMKQVGKPYVYGATGPDSFDCSGLVQYLYKEALGIVIPRVSRDQAKVGVSVTLDQIQVGDIIAFDDNKDGVVTHVGMYVGDGKFIQALKPGKPVELTSINSKYWKGIISTIRRVL